MNSLLRRLTASPRVRDLAALVGIAALVALFFWRVLTPNPSDRAVFPSGDFTDQFYTFRLYEARALTEGRLPLWSPNFNSGHPFLADVQSAVFYPVGLVFMLVSVALFGAQYPLFALELEAIVHFFLAGAFTYLFARRVFRHRGAALVSAVVFTFGGYLTSYPPLQLAILETAVWLPLALWYLDRAAGGVRACLEIVRSERFSALEARTTSVKTRIFRHALRERHLHARTNVYLICAGVVLGIAALAGHPQTFLFVVYASAVYFAWRVWVERRRVPGVMREDVMREVGRPILQFAVVLVIAFGIAAVQWVPSLEYQRVSTREAISFAEAARGFPTLDILQFILPGFVSAFASPLYVGVLALWFAVVGATSPPDPLSEKRRGGASARFWLVLVGGALVVAFGYYAFAYAVVYLFAPGMGIFRQQERLAFIVSFALSLAAGFGWRAVLARGADKNVRRWWALLPMGATMCAVFLAAFFIAGAQPALTAGSPGNPSGRLAFLGDRAGLMVVLFVIASALVGAYARGWLNARVFGVLAIAFMLFDLFSINEPANKAQPVERFPPNALIQTIRQDTGIFRVADEGQMPGHFGIAYNLEEISGISPLRVARYDGLLDLAPEKLYPLLNVKYLITARPGFAHARLVTQDDEKRLLQLDNALPRAWLVGAVEVEPDETRALARLGADDFDARRVALAESAPTFGLDPRAGEGNVTWVMRSAERLVLIVDAPGDGLLMLSEVYYPGWRATVDGVPVDVIRADVALRAVPVRAGSHRVELTFDSWSVKIGMVISLTTVLMVICCACVALRECASLSLTAD